MGLKILTIKKSRDFKAIQNNCKKFHAPHLILLESKTPKNHIEGFTQKNICRFGITTSKNVSKYATQRNLIKRRIRHAITKLSQSYAKPQNDYVVIAKKQIVEVDYNKIYSDLKFCLKRI